MRAPFLSALALLLASCSPVVEDPPEPEGPPIWEEGDDEDNNEPTEPEEVDDAWTEEIVISGHISSCGYDGAESWSWTGDNDAYNVEVPENGYLELSLSWEWGNEDAGLPDLDFAVFVNPSGANWTTDYIASGTHANPEEWLPPQEFERGDDIVIVVACARGGETDYELDIRWEE
jgi:hypothetical protein